MQIRLANLNGVGNTFCLESRNAFSDRPRYNAWMAKPQHDWYAAHWAKLYGKKQAQIARDLEWNTAKVSLTFSGKQAYSRDDINELADLLNLEPFELLMPPERAMNLRQLRASAEQITKLVAAPVNAVSEFETAKVDKARADRRDSQAVNGKAAKKFR